MPSTNSKRRNKERYRPGMNRPMPMKDQAQLPGLVETLIATDPEPPSKQPDHSALPEPLDLELPELTSDIHIVWILRSIAAIAVTLLVFALYGLFGGTL